jgi:trigger factor
MKTELHELEQNRVRLRVEVPVEDVDHAFEHALADLSRSLRVPGFRKGKAPAGLIKQRIGNDALGEEALEGHLSGWYQRAVLAAGIDPVDRPKIDFEQAPEEGHPFAFSAEVEVKPKPEVSTYTGLSGVRPPVEVPEEAVERELERLQLTVAELTPVERPAADGDFVVIDFTGRTEAGEFEGGKGTDYGVELGAGRLLPDMERGIAGMAAGQEREVTVVFPPDYPAEQLAGKEAVFTVTVKDVKERVLPELDDEFAMSVSEFDTVGELRADITERYTAALGEESERVFRSTVLDDLRTRLVTPLPEALVRSRMSEMTRNLIEGLAARGVSAEQYLAMTGQTSQQLVEETIRPQAEDALAKDLALEAVADAEGIEVSDEQIEEWIREQASESEEDADDAVKRLMDDSATLTSLRIDLRMQKALDIAVDNAGEVSPEQAEARAKLWTPEKESVPAGAKGQAIWTPGSSEPA